MKYIYLQVAHTNDNDCDLYRFEDIADAVAFIEREGIVEWIMSDFNDGAFLDSDYTHVGKGF